MLPFVLVFIVCFLVKSTIIKTYILIRDRVLNLGHWVIKTAEISSGHNYLDLQNEVNIVCLPTTLP